MNLDIWNKKKRSSLDVNQTFSKVTPRDSENFTNFVDVSLSKTNAAQGCMRSFALYFEIRV